MERELEFLNQFLTYIFSNTHVDGAGRVWERRHLVTKIKNVKLEIYANEHPPPHFHVKSPDIDASFSLLDGSFLEGKIDGKSKKRVEYYYSQMRKRLVEVWNHTRPDNCSVGRIELN